LATGLGVFDDQADGFQFTAEFWFYMDSVFVDARMPVRGSFP
jgi:hypothetical protein